MGLSPLERVARHGWARCPQKTCPISHQSANPPWALLVLCLYPWDSLTPLCIHLHLLRHVLSLCHQQTLAAFLPCPLSTSTSGCQRREGWGMGWSYAGQKGERLGSWELERRRAGGDEVASDVQKGQEATWGEAPETSRGKEEDMSHGIWTRQSLGTQSSSRVSPRRLGCP